MNALRRTRRSLRSGVMAALSLTPAEQDRIAAKVVAWEGRPFAQLTPCPSWPSELQKAFRRHNAAQQEAYIVEVDGRVIIDGASGYAFHDGRIIPSSLAYAYDARLPSWRMLLPRRRQDVVNNVISLRDPYETNYFHFFNDLLAKVLFARQHLANLHDHAFLVAERVYQSRWFQALLTTDLLRHYRFVVQRQDEPIACERAIFIKAPPHHREFIEAIATCARNHFGRTDRPAAERVFLLRGAETAHGRIPSNQRELAARLREQGFEAVDPATLPWPEQVAVMRHCQLLVGPHGAGMTNLIFRGPGPLTVVELFPRGFSPPHYYWMAELLGYHYLPRCDRGNGRIDIEDVVATVQGLA
jgi:hypothetical protein